jgi:pimeloyl-ACP methyl ester carboxylesterase
VRHCPRLFRGPPDRHDRFVDVAGLTGVYTDVGAGPPVVILASTLVRARSYHWLSECLAPHFRVLAVEMPASGRASRPPRPWGFEDYAQWAAHFLEKLDLRDVTLIGHSNSGGTVMVMAAAGRLASRLGRIVLADSVGGDVSPSLPRALLGRAIDAVLEPRLTLFGWHHVLYNAFFHPATTMAQVWISVHEDLRRYAAAAKVPALVAWGARDHTIPPRCAAALRDAIPNAELYVSPRGSHDWLLDRAEEFTAVLRDFVRRTGEVRG